MKNALVCYLALHATGRPWLEKFKKAGARYLNDQSDVGIFGVFVRDVAPHPDDCSGRASKLAFQCPPLTVIELLALYFPAGTEGAATWHRSTGDQSVTASPTIVNRLQTHWAISSLNSGDLKRAFKLAETRLVHSAVGSQMEIEHAEVANDANILDRVAIAYELAAVEGLNALLHPSGDEESKQLRDQAQDAAHCAFELRRAIRVTGSPEERVSQVLHLAASRILQRSMV